MRILIYVTRFSQNSTKFFMFHKYNGIIVDFDCVKL